MPALITVKGLVLHETAYGESDKMFELFTENGIYSVSARGVRKNGSKYAAVTQVFSYGNFCLRQSGERFYLDSAESISLFYELRSDLDALALAAYFAELIRKTATNQPQPQLLRLFLHCLHYLCQHSRPLPQLKAIFEMRLVTELGHAPNLLCCIMCGEFLPPQLYVNIETGSFYCKACNMHRTDADYLMKASVLKALRHIVFSEFDRLFLFRLDEHNLLVLQDFTEKYAAAVFNLWHLRTLEFYHQLTDQPENDPAAANAKLFEKLRQAENGTEL